ncbi:WD40 repeat domain-containing protein [Actinomadura sp. ATCC 31491]|uniref:WD40 repeat domain-containing protein n=1 Tax=Actinomadura luzonensis TaxID=2805427 RepID=A0ABT0G2N6_9ACTN|nr:WD40 repeat domain-containing protein [Actinomadura luzonensis]MCK2218371.1 WD40 repeat domain-containing protein [Actinomadura luzonensis]
MSTAGDPDRQVEALLHGDPATTSGEVNRITRHLVGPAQPLIHLLRRSVAADDRGTLRHLHEGDTPLHGFFNQLMPAEYPIVDAEILESLGYAVTGEDSAAVPALRSAAGLARSLVEEDALVHLRTSVQWWSLAHSSPLSSAWVEPPERAGNGDERLRRRMKAMSAIVKDDPSLAGAAMTASVLLLFLDGRFSFRGPSASLNVLFDLGDRGMKARLTGTSIRSWPRALVPDPRRMALFTADQDFQLALTRAWTQAGGTLPGTVVWSIENAEGPVGTISGESLGAAFAVLLDELRLRDRSVLRNPVVLRLVGSNTVVGRIDDLGNMQSVEGYGHKLRAAGKNARVIVPAQDEQKAHEAGEGVIIVPAANWRKAAKKARRPDFVPLARWSLAPLLVIVLVAGAAFLVQRHFAEIRRKETLSRRVSQWSDILRERNPVLSGLLAATAWHFSPTDEARYGMVATIATSAQAVLEWPDSMVWAVAYSPDGSTLASAGGDGAIRLWDAATRRMTGAPLTGQPGTPYELVFSPRGDVLATADDQGYVRLWNVPLRRAIGEFRHGDSRLNAVAFSRDGDVLVTTSSDGTVRRWDVATRCPIGEPFLAPPGSTVRALSSDGRMLAISADNGGPVQLWDLEKRRRLGTPLKGPVTSAAFSSDGTKLAVVAGNGVRVWDVRTRRPAGDAFKGPAVVTAAAFSPDNATLGLAGKDGTIQLRDAGTGRPFGNPLRGHTANVTALAFHPLGGTLASTGADGTTRLWNLDLFHPAGSPFEQRSGAVTGMAYRPDGTLLATGSRHGTVQLWDTAAHRPSGAALAGHEGQVSAVVFSPDGRTLATGGNDRSVRLWDVATHRSTARLPRAHEGEVLGADFSRDGRLLATVGTDGTARLWDAGTGRAIGDPLRAEREVPKPYDYVNYINAVAFSPDGRHMATGAVLSVRLWDVTARPPSGVWLNVDRGANDLTFDRHGRVLATAEDSADDNVRLWDVAGRRQIGDAISVPEGSVEGVAFSPDGLTLATGASDGTVRLWDVRTHRPLGGPLGGHGKGFTYVAFSPDGTVLASGGADGRIRLWNVAMPADPFSAVCAIAGRSLTKEEWRRYVPGEPFTEICR